MSAPSFQLPASRFPLFFYFSLDAGGFGEDLPLINTVERRFQFRAGAGANHIAADVLQETEFLRGGVEGDEIDLHTALALAPDFARHALRIAAVRVLAVGHDQQVLAEHAGAIQVGARFAHGVANRGAAARPRQVRQDRPNRLAVVRLNRPERADAAREAVEADFDWKIRPLRDEGVGGIEHRLDRLARDDVFDT